MANKKNTKPTIKEKMDTIQETIEPNTLKPAVIKDCARLNMRKAPRPNANVISILDDSSSFKVDTAFQHKEFYKIINEKGVHGFCMKKYVKVKK